MNGLYQRALEIYRQRNGLRLISKGDEEEGLADISAEERETILHEIDGILANSRVKVGSGPPRGGKSGLLLPILVNAAVFAAVALAIFLFTRSLNGEESRFASGTIALAGAESQVFEALKQESAAQLGQKDQAILAFQKKLDEASAERDRIRKQSDEVVRKREGELAAQMASALEAEKSRLSKSGIAPGAADDALKRYEEKLKADAARQSEAFQRKAAEEAAASEAAVNGLIAEYQSSLSQAQAERSRLQQQYQSRESELRSQYTKDAAALKEDKAKALADLERMRELGRQEDLVMGRILASYDEINASIRKGENEAALKSIAALRDSLDQEPARSLAAVKRRRPVELFILGSLEELVRSRAEKGDAASLVATKTRLETLWEKSARADKEYLSKNIPSARELYLSALSEIPEAKAGHERLEAMDLADQEARLELRARTLLDAQQARTEAEKAQTTAQFEAQWKAQKAQAEAQRAATLASQQALVAEGDSLERNAAWQATLDRYGQALGILLDNPEAAKAIVAQLAEAGYRIGAERSAAEGSVLPDRIALVREELRAKGSAETASSTAAASSAEFASLLQAKLLLWQIVGSEPIKSQHPELYGTMQKYFDTFASQQREEGRADALREVLALTEALRKGETPAKAAARLAPASDRDSMLKLLDGLEALVRDQATTGSQGSARGLRALKASP